MKIEALVLVVMLAALAGVYAKADTADSSEKAVIMFWNLENYFDPFDDSLTADEEFLPAGYKHWTWKKFEQKRNAVAKTVLSVKDELGSFPVIVGFAEVENYMVLSQLVRNTPLAKLGYGIVHRDSPDRRGVDVGLIYRESCFRPVKVKRIPVNVGERPTRDILYVRGVLGGSAGTGDTIDLFVVHWPSKFGGEKATESLRQRAAETLADSAKSMKISHQNIIVMGDFNDSPDSESISYLVDSLELVLMSEKGRGANLIDGSTRVEGTIKYNGKWELIDNFLVGEKLKPETGQRPASMLIYNHAMLLEEDTKYLGVKPFRTYYGPRWHGGASDHLPIVLILP